MADGLMLDPSLLLHKRTLGRVREAVVAESSETFWVPETVVLAASTIADRGLLYNFVTPPALADLARVQDLLEAQTSDHMPLGQARCANSAMAGFSI
jgi:hypothetical protein